MPRIAIFVALILSACAPRPPVTLHDIAEEYVRLTLQFAQHQPSLVDAWVGPDSWQPGPRRPVAELHAALDDLRARLDRIVDIDRTEQARLTYLRGQLAALKVVARRLSGESTRFEDELDALWPDGVRKPEWFDLSRERAALEQELPGEGDLVDRIVAFRLQYLVPPDRTERVFRAAVDACRRATAAHIQLPAGEAVDIRFEPAGDWEAAADYRGRHQTRVRIASRAGHDVAQLLHIACHETYPGHHLQHVLVDDALVRGRGWSEFQLTPAFGPHLFFAEGFAEVGVDLAMPIEASARVYRDTLMPLAGLRNNEAERLARVDALAAMFSPQALEIIGRYLDNERSNEQTQQDLRIHALIPSPDRLIALAERRRIAAVVYGASKQAILHDYKGTDAAAKWRMLHDMFTVAPFTLQ